MDVAFFITLFSGGLDLSVSWQVEIFIMTNYVLLIMSKEKKEF